MSSNQGDAQTGKESTEAASRQSLPFEPKSRKPEPKAKKQPIRKAAQPQAKPQPSPDAGIPQVVSRRMARRMAFFCGVPTMLGMLTFVVSYLVVSNDLLQLPTYAVLLVSLGCFGLGVVGLTYGVLSASWEEDAVGSRLGFAEFKTNLGRTTDAWRENAQKAKAARAEAAQDKVQDKAQDKADKKS
ncbi:PAM68 family protein [Phormidium tenue FACHB-886]|nr:PAM68 family protein [Phormidium tenue FACHB-886]